MVSVQEEAEPEQAILLKPGRGDRAEGAQNTIDICIVSLRVRDPAIRA
jgi:hypothetical protein